VKLETLTPMLRTWDLPATIAFYTEVLGFERESVSEDMSWASLTRDGVAVMLARPSTPEGDQKPAFTGSLYFTTDDVDDLWEQLKDRAQICYPIESFDYGMREFGIYDNNGYLLQFGEMLPNEEDPYALGRS
jgi:uncharacterized glyoxalase superfamily protein PhnB